MKKEINEEKLWTADDERLLFERYEQEGKGKPDFLLGQAYSLFALNLQKDAAIYDSIGRIIERYNADFPSDKANRTAVLFLQGRLCSAKNDDENAIEFFKKAAEGEASNLKHSVGAYLEFAELVINKNKTEYFEKAEKYLLAHYEKLGFSLSAYSASVLLWMLAKERGDEQKQAVYRERADKVLCEISKANKKLRYVRVVRLNRVTVETKDIIKRFILDNGFELGSSGGETVWQKKGFACVHNVGIYALVDAVVIIGFISFKDFVTGNYSEMGLNGWVAAMGKWPLKKLIDNLEKSLQ